MYPTRVAQPALPIPEGSNEYLKVNAEHVTTVNSAGFGTWQRTITMNGRSEMTLNATLEQTKLLN